VTVVDDTPVICGNRNEKSQRLLGFVASAESLSAWLAAAPTPAPHAQPRGWGLTWATRRKLCSCSPGHLLKTNPV
jgi:hypothetical protein